jgi:cytochrome c oxidase cbb3-type subunit I/II
MPAYRWLRTNTIDFEQIQHRVDVMAMLGVPYGDAVNRAPAMARAQADSIAADIAASGGPADLKDREIVALVAYIQRLGRDIHAQSPVVAVTAPAGATP